MFSKMAAMDASRRDRNGYKWNMSVRGRDTARMQDVQSEVGKGQEEIISSRGIIVKKIILNKSSRRDRKRDIWRKTMRWYMDVLRIRY